MQHQNDYITKGMDGVRVVVSSISVSHHFREDLQHHGRAIVLNVGDEGPAVYLSLEQAEEHCKAIMAMVAKARGE